MKSISQYKLIIFSSILFVLFYNFSFFKNVIQTYPIESTSIIHLISIFVLLIFLVIFLFTLFSSKYTTKPILILVFLISTFTAYFMDTYHVVIDEEMIRNTLQTNLAESSDLFSLKLIAYILFFAIIPIYMVYKANISYQSTKKELIAKVKIITLSLTIIVVIILSFSKFYSSFFREHKPLRYSVNPVYWMYSIGKYISKTASGTTQLKEIGKDAKVVEDAGTKKDLIIMVVGETARADRFSLNGYEKETNPLLKKEEVLNLTNLSSCGTSTAVSVPCMFSIFNIDDYDYKKGVSTQNVVDVLKNTKDIEILWRDNNSSSKGVADRIDFEDYRTNATNTICTEDGECRDEGMLIGLENYIEKNKDRDILIVLHQMGNHGPAYYKRYPKEFEKFTPVCKTNQLEQCTKEEVSNAYDNAILYTDYFLSKVINFLKPYSASHETAMIYMSDHGESLGENGLYLHGMPYFMAPKEQTHIPGIIWLGNEIKKEYDLEKVKTFANQKYTHNNLFHTMLGIFDVQSEVYKKELDILHDAKKH